MVLTEALLSSELRRYEFCGEADPAMYPSGDGRVETEAIRVALTALISTRIRSPRRVYRPKSSGFLLVRVWVAGPLFVLGWPVGFYCSLSD